MVKGYEVLEMLIPQGGWIISGDEYEGITFLTCDPISKKEFLDGFKTFEALKAQKELDNANNKAIILDRLGITAEEAQLLLS